MIAEVAKSPKMADVLQNGLRDVYSRWENRNPYLSRAGSRGTSGSNGQPALQNGLQYNIIQTNKQHWKAKFRQMGVPPQRRVRRNRNTPPLSLVSVNVFADAKLTTGG